MRFTTTQKFVFFALTLATACGQSNPPTPLTAPAAQTPNDFSIDPIGADGHCTPTFVEEWNQIAAVSKLLDMDIANHALSSDLVKTDLQDTTQACAAFYANETGVSCLAQVKGLPKLVNATTPNDLCEKSMVALGKNTLRTRTGGNPDIFSNFDTAPAGLTACEEGFLLVYDSFKSAMTSFLQAREKVLTQEENRDAEVNADDAANALAEAKLASAACDSLITADQNNFSCALASDTGPTQQISLGRFKSACQVAASFQLDKPVVSNAFANARLRRAETAFPMIHPIQVLPADSAN